MNMRSAFKIGGVGALAMRHTNGMDIYIKMTNIFIQVQLKRW